MTRRLAPVLTLAAVAACADPASGTVVDAEAPDAPGDARVNLDADPGEGGKPDGAAIGKLFAFTASSDGKLRAFADSFFLAVGH